MGKALDDLLSSFGKQSYSKHTRDCAGIGCQQRVFEHALFCPECWRQISSDLQRLIGKHHRPGRKPAQQLAYWIQQAIDELAYIRLNGRRPPQPQSFMWDDETPAPATAAGELLEALGDAPPPEKV